MASNDEFTILLHAIATQVDAFEKRERSPAERRYGNAMRELALSLTEILRTASFDELIHIEKIFQRNDLVAFAKVPATKKSVQQGIDDLDNGEEVYKQLLENTQGYQAHKYRENERAAPDKLVPLDAMRRALRGQAKRVENYRKNVMGNSSEQEFLSARIAMIRQAEKLYDTLQRKLLL